MKASLLAGAFLVSFASTSVTAQTSPSGINATSPGSAPATGGSYSPSSPLPPIVTTPIGGSMGDSSYGSTFGTAGSSLGNGPVSGSGNGSMGARSGSSDFGRSSGAGSVTGAGGITGSGVVAVPGSTAPQPSIGSTQGYVDQAELARCNGLAAGAREDCVGALRNRMDINSGVGARSSAGGRIGTGNGVGIAPGNQLPRPMIGPTAPSASNVPMGPGGAAQGPVTNPVAPVTPAR